MLPRSRLDICILIIVVGCVCAALIPGSRLLIAALIAGAVLLVAAFPEPSGTRADVRSQWSEYFWSSGTPPWVRVVAFGLLAVLAILFALTPGSGIRFR